MKNRITRKAMAESNLTYGKHISFSGSESDIDYFSYLTLLVAFSNLTNNIHYIFDYKRNRIVYTSDTIEFLGHRIPLTENGYQFYEKYVHPDDLNLLERVNKAAFDFFYSLSDTQKRKATIVYDIRLRNSINHYFLINHHLTPLQMTAEGIIELALCMISPSCYQQSGNVYIKLVNTNTVLEYNSQNNSFEEVKYQNLTIQQSRMLELSARGLTESQIADDMNVSVNTIKAHKKDLFKRLYVPNMQAAIQWFNNQK